MDEPMGSSREVGAEAEAVFEARDVAYRYDDVAALDGLSLRVAAGERVVLLGANGSGKSTLLRLLDGLDFAAAGSIRAFGVLLTPERLQDDDFCFPFRRRVGFVFQNPDVQLFNPTVFDELAFGPLQMGWTAERVRGRVERVLESMDLGHLRARATHRLSGGEKKRVALASVLVLEPEVLLLDEPTAVLDPTSQSQIIDLLVGWAGGTRTVVTATNDLDIVEDVADRCAILQDGRVVADGPPTELLHDVELLGRTRLLHAHRHTHGAGMVHRHHHRHRHEHGPGARGGSGHGTAGSPDRPKQDGAPDG